VHVEERDAPPDEPVSEDEDAIEVEDEITVIHADDERTTTGFVPAEEPLIEPSRTVGDRIGSDAATAAAPVPDRAPEPAEAATAVVDTLPRVLAIANQ
jgi:hypothetical protein